ncbi:MAG: hypothetical protein HC930_08440 [Hydrococcus sp. SU_1_0]|nr:hypothetical protein [Hydrococcus sp. SU_1_0]
MKPFSASFFNFCPVLRSFTYNFNIESLDADRTQAIAESFQARINHLNELIDEASDSNELILLEQQTINGVHSIGISPALSGLEFQINEKLRSIDAYHAHIDSNRNEIDYLGRQTDALLDSM